MKTEFLKGLELTDEQIKAIQAESGKDVNAEKEKADTLEKKLKAAEDSIAELKAMNAEGLQRKIGELETQIAARRAEDERAANEKALFERFEKAAGNSKFVNELTKNGIFQEFKSALKSEENKGKADGDIYSALTKDREDIFASRNPAVDIPGISGDAGKIADEEIRSVMGLPPA